MATSIDVITYNDVAIIRLVNILNVNGFIAF